MYSYKNFNILRKVLDDICNTSFKNWCRSYKNINILDILNISVGGAQNVVVIWPTIVERSTTLESSVWFISYFAWAIMGHIRLLIVIPHTQMYQIL